jgi:hypothetical protein
MITLDQWNKLPDFRERLAVLLRDTAMVAALEVTLQKGVAPVAMPKGVDLMAFTALMGARKEGYVEALQNLQDLAELPTMIPKEEKPWKTPAERIQEILKESEFKPEPILTNE